MLFGDLITYTDLTFWIYTLIIWIIFKKLKTRKTKNTLLLIYSYVVYSSLGIYFIFPLILSTIIDYFCGIITSKDNVSLKRVGVLTSLIGNLSLLIFYKYFRDTNVLFLNSIIFPIGISFYTFQSISYTLDIYKGRIKPEKSFIKFALYVSFFPQLLAGPIEQAHKLLPQFSKSLNIFSNNYIEKGLHLIILGLFKKVYISNNLLIPIKTYAAYNNNDSLTILLLYWCVFLQVYVDFSGYSDIARGIAKLFKIELIINFRFPYLAKNPIDFWNRWHISFTVWVRDYLFRMIRPKKFTKVKFYLSLTLSFFIIGIWHGTTINWTLFGIFNALCVLLYSLFKRNSIVEKLNEKIFFNRVMMFFFSVALGFLHQNRSLGEIQKNLYLLVTNFSFTSRSVHLFAVIFVIVIPLLIYEIFQIRFENEFFIQKYSLYKRSLIYCVALIVIVTFNQDISSFVYFEF